MDFRIRYVSPIIGFARVWQKCVNGALQYPYQDNVRHVFYENLLAEPVQHVRSICEFLDVEYCEDMLSGFEQEAQNLLSVDRCPWQRDNTIPGFRQENVGNARRELSSGDIWLIQRAVKELASAYGYYVTSTSASLASRFHSLLLEFIRYGVYASSLELPLRRLIGAIKK